MANAWTSSPPPSLDALAPDSPASSSALLVGWHVASTLPRWLWDVYVAYLWHYQPNSWIGRVASAFRVLAVILVLPVVLLTLLDVASYVIARTLGVVDDVKASTSDADTTTITAAHTGTINTSTGADGRKHVAAAARCSLLHGLGGPGRAFEDLASEDLVGADSRTGNGEHNGEEGDGHGHQPGCVSDVIAGAMSSTRTEMQIRSGGQGHGAPASDSPSHACYFAGDEDPLRLAGEGVFSPAASMPPSPTTPRVPLHILAAESDSEGSRMGQTSGEEGIMLRRRAVQHARELDHT